jgi:TRAP-type transport system small permease protein
MLKRVEDVMARLLEAAAMLMMATLVAAITYSVFARQVLRISVPWSEEVGAGLLLWMVMLGSAAAWSRRRHIAIDVILRRSGIRVRYALSIFIELSSLLLFSIAMAGAVSMMQVSAHNSTTALRISYSYLYLALVIGLGAMILFGLMHLGRLLVGGPAVVAQEGEWNTSSSS